MIRFSLLLFTLFVAVTNLASISQASQPIVTDSRIKTFIYNENDVFKLLTHYGYQSNIEFGPKEKVVTISLGDRVAWQIVPAGRRIFIRALEENSETNMTIITNERAYQFDLRSSGGGNLKPSEELVYVARFYYPENDDKELFSKPIEARRAIEAASKKPENNINLQYTYTGDDDIAPVKMFDNGKATFLKLPAKAMSLMPRAFIVDGVGREKPVGITRSENGFVMIPTVARKITLRFNKNNKYICVYNEKR